MEHAKERKNKSWTNTSEVRRKTLEEMGKAKEVVAQSRSISNVIGNPTHSPLLWGVGIVAVGYVLYKIG